MYISLYFCTGSYLKTIKRNRFPLPHVCRSYHCRDIYYKITEIYALRKEYVSDIVIYALKPHT